VVRARLGGSDLSIHTVVTLGLWDVHGVEPVMECLTGVSWLPDRACVLPTPATQAWAQSYLHILSGCCLGGTSCQPALGWALLAS
jgi:hypothetical protein